MGFSSCATSPPKSRARRRKSGSACIVTRFHGRLACTYDASKDRIEFAPRINPENFKCFFATAEGWGQYSQRIRGDAMADQKTVDAVVLNLEIIGEAAKNLSDSSKESLPETEWKKIIAMRNILAHEYFGVSNQIVWDIVQNKLDPLKKACKKALEEN